MSVIQYGLLLGLDPSAPTQKQSLAVLRVGHMYAQLVSGNNSNIAIDIVHYYINSFNKKHWSMRTTFSPLCLFLGASILISCSNHNNEQNAIKLDDTPTSRVDYLDISELKNSPKVIGKISSFDVINDNSFVISTISPPQVIVFDKTGTQIEEIGSHGKGPYEFMRPSIVKHSQNNIYVWCQGMLKLIVFTTDGKPINQYEFDSAIKDFEIHDNWAFLYTSGGLNESIVTVFDLTNGKYIEHAWGQASKEHQMLNMKEFTGGIALKDSFLFFSPTNFPEVSIVDLASFNLVSNKKILDPEFTMEEIPGDINDFLRDQDKSVQYIFGSNVVTGIYVTDSIIVIRTEIGNLEMEGLYFKDASKRKYKSYVFDRNMQLISTYSEPALDSKHRIYSAHNSEIYAIGLSEDLEGYKLQKVNITNNTTTH